MAVNLDVEVGQLTKNIEAQLNVLDQDIEVDFGSSIIYAFSPVAYITQLENSYLITITDKNGTTSAEIPAVTKENIDGIITEYFAEHPIIQQYIQQHNISQQAHADMRQLIQNAFNSIPTRVSQLENDSKYATTFKDLIVEYNTYWDFPNIPSNDIKDMVFLDKSTGDMYVFGINNSLTYSSIGLSTQDTIYGGDASS